MEYPVSSVAPPSGDMEAVVRNRDSMGHLAAIVQLFHRIGKELLLEGQADMVNMIFHSMSIFH